MTTEIIAACDRLAGSRFDQDLLSAPGIDPMEIDGPAAVAACQTAVDVAPDNARLHFQYGRALHVVGDMAGALSAYTRAMEGGSAAATNNIGYMHYNGDGVPPNTQLGLNYYQQSADGGFPLAQYLIAVTLLEGRDLPPDNARAVALLEQSAGAGFPSALQVLGYVYEEGIEVPANTDTALFLYNQAAVAGEPYALMSLGRMYAEGIGVETDLSRALYYYRQAEGAGIEGASAAVADVTARQQWETDTDRK